MGYDVFLELAFPSAGKLEGKIKNGANGIRDIEGKAARVAAIECGQRASLN